MIGQLILWAATALVALVLAVTVAIIITGVVIGVRDAWQEHHHG
jgi:hypothetical protein